MSERRRGKARGDRVVFRRAPANFTAQILRPVTAIFHKPESTRRVKGHILNGQIDAIDGRKSVAAGVVRETVGGDQDIADLLGVPVIAVTIPFRLESAVASIAQGFEFFRPSAGFTPQLFGRWIKNLDPFRKFVVGIAFDDFELHPPFIGGQSNNPSLGEWERVEVHGQSFQPDVPAILEHGHSSGLAADQFRAVGQNLNPLDIFELEMDVALGENAMTARRYHDLFRRRRQAVRPRTPAGRNRPAPRTRGNLLSKPGQTKGGRPPKDGWKT